VSQYPSKYSVFNAQNVVFDLLDETSSTYGTYTALYDLYDGMIYDNSTEGIKVSIDAGDGKYLQMCATLPSLVNADAQLSKLAYLSGPITIDNCAEVTVHESTITTILPHSTIIVKGGSILNLAGTVTIADSVSIIVEQGSSINFNGAICTWGYASGISIDGSEMTAISSTLKSVSESQRWQGILASNESTISLDDTEINGAVSNTIYNSNVYLIFPRRKCLKYST
jgi:hypothetical protein